MYHRKLLNSFGEHRWTDRLQQIMLFLPLFIYSCFSSLTELAASVPRTEIVGKSDYFRFGMRDSLALEASFLQVIMP